MRKITLKKLIIKNFKGIKYFESEFNTNETTIFGANEAGKTSLYDALCWLLFNKDSSDKKDFNIKPLDVYGLTNKEIKPEVYALINVDGLDIELKKIYSEKWTKPRGQLDEVFSGNETAFFYNEVPLKETDYKLKIASIIDEALFKLLTNPLLFNSMKADEKRQRLISMCSTIESSEVINKIDSLNLKEQVDNLIAALNQNKSIKEYKAEISSKIKTIKDENVKIPTRIDEAYKSLPIDIPNYTEVEAEISKLNADIEAIDAQINDKNEILKSEYERIAKQQKDKFLLETQLRELKNKQALESNNKGADVKNEIATKERLLLDNARSIEDVKISISRNNNIINTLTAENNAIRQHWIAENEKQLTFDENEFNCPACKQPLPTDKIENSKKELTANFNLTKKTKLENIEKAGVENKSRIENAQKLIEGDKAKLETLQAQKATIEEQITDLNKSLTELLSRQKTEVENSEIKALENRIAEFVIDEAPKVDVDDLKSKKVSINASIDELKAKLALKETIEKTNARIKELEELNIKYSSEISMLEKQEFVIDSYNKEYMTSVEENINKLFRYVRFKMFEKQINGGDNPICEATYKGVPFNDVNTAGKILCGIDIINGLSRYYNISVPMFLDNRESVTDIPATEAQIINLVVSPEHKVLTVKK